MPAIPLIVLRCVIKRVVTHHKALLAFRQLSFGPSAVKIVAHLPEALFCSDSRTPARFHHIGNVNRNVDPSPTSDSAQIRPPCRSTMRRHKAKPNPVPGALVPPSR